MSASNLRGIRLMVATVAVLAVQDGFSRYLAGNYNTMMVVALRYWVFAGFVILTAARRPEGFRAAVATRRIGPHVLRAGLLVGDILLMVQAFTMIGLIEVHAVFAACPLLVVALSGPILGERLGLARWGAVAVGMAGVLVILRPGAGVFSFASLMPFAAATAFALYSVLTRQAARADGAFAAFFWPAVLGAVMMTPLGLWSWQPIVAPIDWLALAAYCGLAVLGNWFLTRTYAVAEASAVQPFAYLQIVFVTGIGLAFFDEVLEPLVALGALVVIGAGIQALVLARRESRNGSRP